MCPHTAHTFALGLVGALALVLAPSRASAQVNVLPSDVREVGITEHLNEQVPLDATFQDHEGHVVRLGDLLDGHRPVVLNLLYYRCPMLCNMVTHGMTESLKRTLWTIGDQYDVISLSIDPREGPTDASHKRDQLLQEYGRPAAAHGWHFLTGSDDQIRRVTEAVGFHYSFVRENNQYAHAAAIFLLTPSARIARYLYGIEFSPNDLRIGLLEASEGRSISSVERLILYCYHYDPHGRRYVIVAMRVMRIGGVLTMILLGGFLAILWSRERRPKKPTTTREGGAPGSKPAVPPETYQA